MYFLRLALGRDPAVSTRIQVPESLLSVPLPVYLRVELLGHMVTSLLRIEPMDVFAFKLL